MQQVLDYYKKTFLENGATPKGVDWSDDGARIRYETISRAIGDPRRVSVLDVGCGYGGFFIWSKTGKVKLDPEDHRKPGGYKQYMGLEIVHELAESCRDVLNQFPENNVSFMVGDFLDGPTDMRFDWVILNGVCSAKVENNLSYAQMMLGKAFEICTTGVVATFLNAFHHGNNHDVYRYSPNWIMNQSTLLTKRWSIDASYLPNDFMVCLRK